MVGVWVEVPDALWREIELLIPVPARRFRYPGRLRHSERACLEGILTVLQSGMPWRRLPVGAWQAVGGHVLAAA
jgi:transposase